MLRLDRQNHTLNRLQQRTLADIGMQERHDLQRMIMTSPEVFFDELGERLLLLAQEVRPADEVDDRIDLLAVDEDGSAVIFELKRGRDKFHLLQALSYASMIAKWEGDEFVRRVAPFSERAAPQIGADIEEFLDVPGALNQNQRVVLLAEEFDYSVLVTAEWLSERYGVDIRCYRMVVAADPTGDFLSLSRVYPPLELTDQARMRRAAPAAVREQRPRDWNEALEIVRNPNVVAFFRQQIEAGCSGNSAYRELFFRTQGRRRFTVGARAQYAYVWQGGRFAGDVDLWRDVLGDGSDVEEVAQSTRLRFRLRTAAQCTAFVQALQGQVARAAFDPRQDEARGGGEDNAREEPNGADQI
ncbi:hypothetical protein [Azospirillum argentinense]